MSKKNSLFKSASIMMALMLIGKVLGVYRDRLNGGVYGTDSIEALAFSAASLIPRTLLDFIFAAAISGSFIPIFNTVMKKEGREHAFNLANNFISIIFTVSTIFTIICIIFSPQIINIIIDENVSPEAISLAILLIRIMFPTIILTGVAFSLVGVVQSLDEFGIPAVMSVLSNLIIIIYYLFFIDTFGIYGVCIAYLIGWTSQVFIQVPFLIKNGFKFRFFINIQDNGIKKIVTLMLPVMISSWVSPVNFLVNASFASTISREAFICLNYAYTLFLVISGVVVSSIANVIFPTLSKFDKVEDYKELGATMSSTIRVLFFLLVPVSFGLVAIGTPLVRFLYQTGEFNDQSTLYTSVGLACFSVGIVGYGLQNVLSRAFYAQKDGKTPAITGIISIVINFSLSMILVKYWGIAGPAIASSISITLASVIMFYKLYKINNNIIFKSDIFNIIQMFFVGAVMFFVVKKVVNVLAFLPDTNINRLITILLPTIVGGLVYLGLGLILKFKEISFVVNKIKKRGN